MCVCVCVRVCVCVHVCACVCNDNCKFDVKYIVYTYIQASYNSFIDLQDKLHQNIGRLASSEF